MKSINIFKTKYESPFIKSIHKTSSGTNTNYLQSILNKREKNSKYITMNKHNKDSIKDKLLYVDKKITAEQQALLGGPNFHQYLADSGSK